MVAKAASSNYVVQLFLVEATKWVHPYLGTFPVNTSWHVSLIFLVDFTLGRFPSMYSHTPTENPNNSPWKMLHWKTVVFWHRQQLTSHYTTPGIMGIFCKWSNLHQTSIPATVIFGKDPLLWLGSPITPTSLQKTLAITTKVSFGCCGVFPPMFLKEHRFGAFFLKQMRSPVVFPTAFHPFCTFKCASLAPSTTPLALKKTSVVLWATAVGIPKSRRRIIQSFSRISIVCTLYQVFLLKENTWHENGLGKIMQSLYMKIAIWQRIPVAKWYN